MMIIRNLTQYVIKRGQNGLFPTLFFLLVFFVFNPVAFAAEDTLPTVLTQSQGQEIIYLPHALKRDQSQARFLQHMWHVSAGSG